MCGTQWPLPRTLDAEEEEEEGLKRCSRSNCSFAVFCAREHTQQRCARQTAGETFAQPLTQA